VRTQEGVHPTSDGELRTAHTRTCGVGGQEGGGWFSASSPRHRHTGSLGRMGSPSLYGPPSLRADEAYLSVAGEQRFVEMLPVV